MLSVSAETSRSAPLKQLEPRRGRVDDPSARELLVAQSSRPIFRVGRTHAVSLSRAHLLASLAQTPRPRRDASSPQDANTLLSLMQIFFSEPF